MKSLCLSFFAVFLLMATAAHALPLKAYKAAQKADDLDAIDTYIDGVALIVSKQYGIQLRADNKEPLFCTPDLALNHDNYLALLDRQIKEGVPPKGSWRDDDAIEVILLRALQRTFPCKK